MTLTLLSFLGRMTVRWPVQSLFKYDDWTTLAATFFATIQAIITLVAVHDGLGAKAMPMSNVNEQLVLKLIYTGSILFVVSLALGKLALSFLCHRLAANEKLQRLSKILSFSITLWGLGSTITIALRQDLSRPWDAASLFVEGTVSSRLYLFYFCQWLTNVFIAHTVDCDRKSGRRLRALLYRLYIFLASGHAHEALQESHCAFLIQPPIIACRPSPAPFDSVAN